MRQLISTLGILGFVVGSGFGATAVFSDEDFATPWVFSTPTNGPVATPQAGGGGSAGFSLEPTGGNPGNHAALRLDIGSNNRIVEAFYETPGAVHDPTVQGPINFVDFVYDKRKLASAAAGNAQAYGPALVQNGIAYYHWHADADVTWTTVSDVGLVATDFAPFFGYQMNGSEANFRPDFSASGSPIQFGYFRGNSTVGVSGWVIGGLDNFELTIDYDAVPEPTAGVLLALAGVVVARRRRSGVRVG